MSCNKQIETFLKHRRMYFLSPAQRSETPLLGSEGPGGAHRSNDTCYAQQLQEPRRADIVWNFLRKV
jgi:hypothetical protein